MSEKQLYLGLETGRRENLVPRALSSLIRIMHEETMDTTRASHGMPAIVRQNNGARIVHPLVGTSGGTFAGHPADFTSRVILTSKRTAYDGHRWGLKGRNGELDTLQIGMSLDTPDPDARIGIPVLVFPGLSPEREQGVHDWLEASAGYTALHIDIGQASPLPGARREMTFAGITHEGQGETLLLSEAASSAMIGIVGLVVETDVHAKLGSQASAAPSRDA